MFTLSDVSQRFIRLRKVLPKVFSARNSFLSLALLTGDKVERSDSETATASGVVSVICAEDHLSGIRNFNEDRLGVSTNRVVPR